MAMIVRNSWVDAEGEVAVARQVDRRSLTVLTGLYFVAATILMVTALA